MVLAYVLLAVVIGAVLIIEDAWQGWVTRDLAHLAAGHLITMRQSAWGPT